MDNVGTVPAALTTYLAIQAFKPDIVISTGALCLHALAIEGRVVLRGVPAF